MTGAGEQGAGARLLFLREEDLRLAQDLMLLAGRGVAEAAGRVLEAEGLGRAHHRVLHFVGRQPGLSVGELLGLLAITKQSLARLMEPLLARGLVRQAPGRADRRQRLLSLTDAGTALERALFEAQRDRLARAYRQAGGEAVEGFRRVMRLMLDEHAAAWVNRREPGR